MNATTSKQIKLGRNRRRRAWFRSRNRYHNPVLVLNMSMFNSETGWETGWNRIFSQRSTHENVWGAHAPRVSFPPPWPKSRSDNFPRLASL
jgi:hypothetical protein